MGLLDLFRPKWKHSRVDVRLEAVRQLGEDEIATLTEVARRDPEAKIREVAYKRLSDPDLLMELARQESDASLRELLGKRTSDLSLRTALEAEDQDAVAAVERILVGKSLADVVRKAKSKAARKRALDRLDDPRALAELAQKAEEPALREQALAKIDDPKALKEVILAESTTKAVQMLALGRLEDATQLRAIVERGRSKAVRNAAKERLAKLGHVEQVEPKKEKAKKAADPAAEARLRQRKIEAEMRRSAEESRKASVAEKKARLEQEHLERLQRMETETAQKEAEKAARAEQKKSEPVVERREERAPRELSPEEQEKRAARDAERAEREAQKAQRSAEKAAQAKDNAAAILSLTERLEALLDGADPKEAGALLKEAHTTPAARGPLPEDAAALRARFEDARKKLSAKLHELREAEDWRRWANVPKLEALITRAESLAKIVIGAVKLEEGQELDARKVSRELKAMQTEWKEIGGAPKVKADALWERFKAASDIIYEGNKKGLDSADEERQANLKMKEELCQKVEALVASPEAQSQGKAISDQIKQLQEDWKKIGPVPRAENDKIWERFRAACDRFFAARKAAFEKQDEVRGQTVERQLALVTRAEALSMSTDWKGAADKLKGLQEEWKALGPGKKGESDEAWTKFRAACDRFFERRKAHFGEQDEERAANLTKKEALVAQAEALAKSEDVVDPDAKIRELMGEWKKIGPVAKDKGDEVWARFGKALDGLRNPTPPSPEVLAEAKGAGFGNKALEGLADKLKAVKPVVEPATAAAPVPVPATAEPVPKPAVATAPIPTPAAKPVVEPATIPAPAPAPMAAPAPVVAAPAPAPVVAAPAPAPAVAAPAPVSAVTKPVVEPATVPAPVAAPIVAAPAPVAAPQPPAPTPTPEPRPVPPPVEEPPPPPEMPPAPVQPSPLPSPDTPAPPQTPPPSQTPTVAPKQDAWPAPEAWSLPDDPPKR